MEGSVAGGGGGGGVGWRESRGWEGGKEGGLGRKEAWERKWQEGEVRQ